ncbi:hypothetical protein ACFX2J_043986 [Malus domestica]
MAVACKTTTVGPNHMLQFFFTVTVNGSNFQMVEIFRSSKEAQHEVAKEVTPIDSYSGEELGHVVRIDLSVLTVRQLPFTVLANFI